MMNRSAFLPALGMAATLFAFGCSDSTKATSSQPPTPPEKVNKTFKLDPKMISGIRMEVLKEDPMPLYLMASGKVQFNEDEVANVIPPVPGQVQELKIKVGHRVEKGEVLFSIYSRDVAASLAEHIDAHKDLDPDALDAEVSIQSDDILVVAQKVVSKAEGRIVGLDTIVPSQRSRRRFHIWISGQDFTSRWHRMGCLRDR